MRMCLFIQNLVRREPVPVKAMDSISRLEIGDLQIGEIGSNRQSDIEEAITNLSVSLTMDMTTQLKFSVYDKDFRMLKNNYFQIRRPMSYNGYGYEITATEVTRAGGGHDRVDITAMSLPIQRMRRAKGAKTWGGNGVGISAALCAQQIAEEFGLKMFIQSSPSMTSVTRQQGEDNDESTWDVLMRLASDLQYIVFESYGVLYFTSEDYLLERQPGIIVDCSNADENDPWFPYAYSFSQDDNNWTGSSFSCLIGRENGMSLRPGMSVTFRNMGLFSNRKHLIAAVSWTEGVNQPVTISGRTLIETEDTVEDTTVGRGIGRIDGRVLVRGSKGVAVERIQMVLGITEVDADGVAIYGPRTIEAVRKWQEEQGLGTEVVTAVSDLDPSDRSFFTGQETITTVSGIDGIFDADDWELLLTPPDSTRLMAQATKGVTIPSDDVSMAGAVVTHRDDGWAAPH